MVDSFQKYLECFENLNENNIDDLLGCMSDKIIFIDPFNKLVGKDMVKSMLKYMFKTLKEPDFKIIYKISTRNTKIVKWRFTCEFLKNKVEFFGLSEIELEKDLVKRHEDYWDSGRNFYCKIPIVGNLFKFFHK